MVSKEQELAMLIEAIGTQVKRKLANSKTLCELPLRDLQVIDFIEKSKKTMGEIAEEFDLTPGTITPLIDKLIEKDLLKRERDESIDRRKVFVSLSDHGIEAYKDHKKQKLKIAKIMLSSIDETEKERIVSSMRKIVENLTKND
ncbi:MAG: MarR family transcriptional regulator [Candidatus Woesearchaeota archaeon]|jgi:DNA-binding MarR family transcriptional regulator|nr:MarR family transcriptional regulator [Candidatus Woesearchaeota archaeon]